MSVKRYKIMEAPKEFGKVVISLENSILPLEVLENTPSRKDGISESLETDLRMVGCDYIQSAGILLKLPQVSESHSGLDCEVILILIFEVYGVK